MDTVHNNDAAYLFHEGTNYFAYKYFGAHFENGEYLFRVWAPNADAAYLVGLFNSWAKDIPMYRVDDAGIWECRLSPERFGKGYNYKYLFINNGREIYKSDPYGFYSELPPETASRFFDIGGYLWNDGEWLKSRKRRFTREKVYEQPINIYEVHLESWKRHEDGSLLTYKELAEELAPYVIQMGYTHIELLPITEYPFDGSWGYQVTGYFAPTSRFGTPRDFMEFVDIMHTAGIGVILDWVPAHFPKDAHGLCEFDGGYLYEYQGADRMEQADWGTRRFDVGREEVQSFLISSALYWAQEYHIDGIRVDAVASMLYLDFCKNEGEWIPNVYGDNRCLEAIAFFQKLNSAMASYFPDVMTIAEESTSWPDMTTFERGGLGFTMKWNMGWMNDTLAYAEEDPLFRKYKHEKLTFTMMYAFNEKYVLPISHDEVVHGKKSFLDKMPGDYDTKFAGARLFYTYLMTLPGKKLSFMGNEIAQFREWAYKESVEWFMLDYEKHARFQLFCATLNHIYLENPCLWEQDGSWAGFSWIDADNRDESMISYRRFDKKGKELYVIMNFTPVYRKGFRIGVGCDGIYEELLSTESNCYGGCGVENGIMKSDDIPWQGLPCSITADIPPMGALIIKCKRRARRTKKKK
ncbi:MAG: 1,4-alpha-glucan branching protein GlgB [Ruminococcaceae bacterium]|nr:1,4-alpha-glucan branching protein GlgB [Oscillospiraceae bacterium]